jgi:hypothetical protein
VIYTPSQIPEITYGQLTRALARLGFVRSQADTYSAYAESEHEALIVLPKVADDEPVSDRHYIAVTATLAGKGISTRDEFLAVLRKAAKNGHHQNGAAIGTAPLRESAESQTKLAAGEGKD